MKATILLIGNILTAAAYYSLTLQLLLFVKRFQLLPLYNSLSNTKHPKKKQLYGVLLALAILFASFISLCGHTHTLNVIDMLVPDTLGVRRAMDAMMLLCAAVSVITALVGYKVFPVVLDILRKFELNSEGNLENAQNYLLEVVEMVKESIMVISDDGTVLRCNEASKYLFDKDLVGTKVVSYVHPDDVQIFNDAILRVLSSYNSLPTNVEYRVRCNEDTFDYEAVVPPAACAMDNRWTVGAARIHCEAESPSVSSSGYGDYSMDDFNQPRMTMALNDLAKEREQLVRNHAVVTYIWIESTICKGMRLNDTEEFEYDLKIASRNINDRKTLHEL